MNLLYKYLRFVMISFVVAATTISCDSCDDDYKRVVVETQPVTIVQEPSSGVVILPDTPQPPGCLPFHVGGDVWECRVLEMRDTLTCPEDGFARFTNGVWACKSERELREEIKREVMHEIATSEDVRTLIRRIAIGEINNALELYTDKVLKPCVEALEERLKALIPERPAMILTPPETHIEVVPVYPARPARVAPQLRYDSPSGVPFTYDENGYPVPVRR